MLGTTVSVCECEKEKGWAGTKMYAVKEKYNFNIGVNCPLCEEL